jgi:hypothetical protein
MIFGYDTDLRGDRDRATNAITARAVRRVDNQSECFEVREKFFI